MIILEIAEINKGSYSLWRTMLCLSYGEGTLYF